MKTSTILLCLLGISTGIIISDYFVIRGWMSLLVFAIYIVFVLICALYLAVEETEESEESKENNIVK